MLAYMTKKKWNQANLWALDLHLDSQTIQLESHNTCEWEKQIVLTQRLRQRAALTPVPWKHGTQTAV